MYAYSLVWFREVPSTASENRSEQIAVCRYGSTALKYQAILVVTCAFEGKIVFFWDSMLLLAGVGPSYTRKVHRGLQVIHR